jgi:hypothetical protein
MGIDPIVKYSILAYSMVEYTMCYVYEESDIHKSA